MGRAIVPLDGSARGEQALPVAASVAAGLGEPIELVHVVGTSAGGTNADSDVSAAYGYLGSVAARLPAELEPTTTVVSGDPAQEILRLSEQLDGSGRSLIVMATHGRGGLGRLVFGSVADRVVRDAHVPVLLVREPAEVGARLDNLLVPLDGSPLAEAALPVAVDLAKRSGAMLRLTRVVTSSWSATVATVAPEVAHLSMDEAQLSEQREIDMARAYLEALVQRIRARGVRATWEVRFGRPAEEIARLAETTGADLLLMSSHGRGGVRRLAFGSVTWEVMRAGRTPVLVVPARAAEPVAEPVDSEAATAAVPGRRVAFLGPQL